MNHPQGGDPQGGDPTGSDATSSDATSGDATSSEPVSSDPASSDADTIVVQGWVAFPPGDRPELAARLVVRVEDVSQADAPSITVAQSVQEGVRLPRDGDSLPFQVSVPRDALDPKRHYSMRIHVDVSGTGTVTTGDFLSTQSYPLAVPPVPTAPTTLFDPVIQVKRI